MQYHCPLQAGWVWAGHAESRFKHGFTAYQRSIPNSLWELPHHSCYWVAYNGRLPEPTPHIADRINGEHCTKITYIYTQEDKYTYVQHILRNMKNTYNIYIYIYVCIHVHVYIYITYIYTYTPLHTCTQLQQHKRANRYR